MGEGCSVAVNDRTVVHRTSEGFATGSPDICLTPPPPSGVPVSYTNTAYSLDVEGTCGTIYCDGNRVAKMSSFLSRSIGDEAGTRGGILSHVNRGKASFCTFSYDVFFEGQFVPRHLDIMGANHGSPPNLWDVFLQLVKKLGIQEIICIVFCKCNKTWFKMFCFRPAFAEPIWTGAFPWLGPYWDPVIPGVWIEVPYRMGESPPTMVSSEIPSKHQKDKDNKPLMIPETWWAAWGTGSKIPDVVIAKDPHKPPTSMDDIKQIYEIKFDGDSSKAKREKQIKTYQKIHPSVTELNKQTCNCDRRKEQGEEEKELERQTAEAAEKNAVAIEAMRKWDEEEAKPKPVRTGVPQQRPVIIWIPVVNEFQPFLELLFPAAKPGGVPPPVPAWSPSYASTSPSAGPAPGWYEGPREVSAASQA